MSEDNITIAAGADLRAAQYKAVTISGTIAANNSTAAGILQNKPNTNEGATVAYEGRMKGTAGAAITKGDRLKVTTSGYLIAVASGDGACGKALFAASSGSVVDMLANFALASTTY